MAREQRRGTLVLQQQHQHHWQAKGSTTVASSSGSPGRFNQNQNQHLDYASEGVISSSSMRDPPPLKTKVVIRHLPPTLSKEAFVSQIDAKFAGTYSWLSFHPGKSTSRKQVYSRAYIGFVHPGHVYAFHECFDGHVFVSEKGSQYKAMVEFAPFQRIPPVDTMKLEGTLLKDPDYIAFCESLAKPVELLPSAEVQLERRESERQGTTKEPIVTALMEYVRSKRQLKPQRGSGSKGYRSGVMGPPPNFPKRKSSDGSKESYGRRDRDGGGRRRRDDYKEKKAARENADNGTIHTEETPSAGVEPDGSKKDFSKRKLLAREKNEASSPGPRNRPPIYRERPARRDAEPLTERKTQRPVRTDTDPTIVPENGHDGRRVKNKDRPDRPVWTPRRHRLDAVQEGDTDAGKVVEDKVRSRPTRDNEPENDLDGRNGATENGIYKYGGGRKGPKDRDDFSKHGKRAAAPSANNEKVWVVKTGP